MLTTDGPSIQAPFATRAGNSSISVTSTDGRPGNIAARPAPSRLGENRL